MNTLLITGTDTDVGKTVLTTSLAAYWQTYFSHKSLGLMKLIQTGVGDRELYQQLFSDNLFIDIIAPLCFKAPLAPPLAAKREERQIDLHQVWQAFTSLQQQQDFVLVEALGGLGSPVTNELTVADLARDWRLNTVLVVPVKLGAIGQAVANTMFASHLGINLKGIILSCVQPDSEMKVADWTPIDLIESLTHVRVLGILPYLTDVTDLSKLTKIASNLDLDKLNYYQL